MFPVMKPLRTFVLALLLGLVLGLVPPAARADQNDPNLERLFAELRQTEDKLLALRIEAEIWRTWHVSGSATVDLLMQRGLVAMSANKFDEAYTHLSSVVELAPEFAEGWNKRATVLFLMQRYEESIGDVDKTLALEPRHFGALSGLGLIHGQLGDDAKALDNFERAVAVNPHMPQIQAHIRRLKTKVRGKKL